MIGDEKRVELLWAQVGAGRDFIARQVRARFYLIGAAFAFAFLLLLPAGVPPALLNGIATKYGISDFRAPEALISTLVWFCWSTVVLQACSRSLVIAREAKYLRVLESRLLPLAGPIVTRYTEFAKQPAPFLRSAEIGYFVTFSGTTLLVGSSRLLWEWRASDWNPAFPAVNTFLFAATTILIALAMRDLAKN